MFRVHMPQDWNADQLSDIKALLPQDIDLTQLPSPVDMVICGRPTAELLRCCTPSYLLLPFAGVPQETLGLLRTFRSIRVHNLHHNAGAASETALALMLAAARGLLVADAALRRGDWSPRYTPGGTILLLGSRVLILGCGSIGTLLRRACEALGAVVHGVRRNPDPDPSIHTPDSLNDLLKTTDFLACCLPLTEETRGMIGSHQLSLLHSRSVLVNVGRAEVVSEEPLYNALSRGEIGAAGLDVWYRYPGDPENTMPSSLPFHKLANVVMSPHRAGAYGVPELERKRTIEIARAIRAGAEGKPVPNPVDIELGY
ncbi:MAG: NAD(P)-dependent oxidoreductase [Candidatus Fermentibacteraceae bacterium]